ncbi:MAG: prepilin-type N-terminal cleavage/methylation domain-containing protein [Kineosporiaceae bacterium]
MRAFRRRPDHGMSLVELAVAMAISTIVLAALGAVFVSTISVVRTTGSQTSTSADARIGMEAMTRSLRVAIRPDGLATALAVADSSAVSVYSLLNRTGATAPATLAPTLVEYTYDGTCVWEAQTPARTLSSPASGGPYYAWDTGRTEKCLLRTTVAPHFAYYTTPVLSTGGTDVAPLTVPGGGLDEASRATVVSVQITLVVRDAANPDLPGVTDLSRVTLTNVIADLGGAP